MLHVVGEPPLELSRNLAALPSHEPLQRTFPRCIGCNNQVIAFCCCERGFYWTDQSRKISELPKKKWMMHKQNQRPQDINIRNCNRSIWMRQSCYLVQGAAKVGYPLDAKSFASGLLVCFLATCKQEHCNWYVNSKRYPSWRISLISVSSWFSDLYSFPMIAHQFCCQAARFVAELQAARLAWSESHQSGRSEPRQLGIPRPIAARLPPGSLARPQTASQQRRQRQSCWEAKVHA